MHDSLPSRDLVLVGAGHTNAHIIRMWRMESIPDVRLTVVTPYSRATYSGMLPGTLAGLYRREDMEIDLYRLAEAVGARLVIAEVTGIDPKARRIHLNDRPSIRYDVCSIGIGSVPAGREIWDAHPEVLSIKPMATFLDRLDARLAAVNVGSPVRIHVVGAGAAGVEVTLCLDSMLRKRGVTARITLVDSGERILSGYIDRTVEIVRRVLEDRGIDVRHSTRVEGYANGRMLLDGADAVESDIVLWATKAAPPPVLEGFDLPKTDDGFLAVRSTLQTTGDFPVFVVGDTATIVDNPVPKAGVYAVREGPVLWDNVRRLFRGEELRPYDPQSGFLSLLAVGDGRAVGQYRGRAAIGKWVWHVKDHIDQSFMNKHRPTEPMTPEMMTERERARKAAARSSRELPEMRCRGCGGKVGSTVIEEALSRLDIPPSPYARQGLDAPDDATLLAPEAGALDVISVDFFHSFLDDPYVVGRVAALNALSDLYAMGSKPAGALAMVTLPEGPRKRQSELLYQILAGGLHELRKAGATLLGGHTTEAAELTIGYTVLGHLDGAEPFVKGALRSGDRLVLTKPLGTATLLAGLPLLLTRAEWMDAMLASMLQSNARAADVAREFGATGVTDVTGFGLAGHLLEMIAASGMDATIDVDALPLLDGFESLAGRTVKSSLEPANREIESRIDVSRPAARESARYAALFDPQTSGGLLIAVAAEQTEDLVARLRHEGYEAAAAIGTVGDASVEAVIRVDG